jgi:DNA polymerase V
MTDLLVLDLLRNNYKCRCVGLSIVYKDEGGFGRQITLESSTNSQKKILDAMYSLYDKFIDNSKLIRGVRIRASQLEINDYTNFNLFENIELLEKERKFYKVYDDIKEKFGKNSINKAISYTEEGNQIFRNTLIGGHNE